jgi:hypothetical protein
MDQQSILTQYLEEIKGVDFTSYFEQHTKLSRKEFLIRDLRISARDYQQLKEQGVTPNNEDRNKDRNKREWVRFNFSEYLWMKMVISLRNLGYPYSYIKKAKNYLFESENLDYINQLPGDKDETLNQLLSFYIKDELPSEFKFVLKELMGSDAFLQKFKAIFSNKKTKLERIVFEAYTNKNTEIGIGFFDDGDCVSMNWNIILQMNNWAKNTMGYDLIEGTIRRPHVYISMSKLIMDFISEDEKIEREISHVLLSPAELKILRAIRSNEYKNIIVNYDKGTNTKILKTEKEKKVKESEIKNFMKDYLFAPFTTHQMKKTNSGDLIINIIKTTKLNNK